MGRRRKQAVRITKKKLPKVFLCPRCGQQAIRVEILSGQDRAIVLCGNCGLTDELASRPAFQEIDIYCKFTDTFYSRTTSA